MATQSIDELKELQDAIDRLESAAFEGKRELSAVADLREQLLLDESAKAEDFSGANIRRDMAQAKIDRAARLLPDMQKQLAGLHTAKRKEFKETSRSKKIALARKIEVGLLGLIGLAQEAQELDSAEHEALGADTNPTVAFTGMLTAAGLDAWKRFIDRELHTKGQAYVEPPRPNPQAPKPVPVPNERGLFGINFLTRSGKFQRGDKVALPETIAKELVEKGEATFDRIL